jgi:RNA polymerase sigma factor (sigma-70 family)
VTNDEDHAARFVQLMVEFAQPMRRLCAAYANRAVDRDDLFQEIFLAVWRALPAFRGDASARTWLYRIAHNVALTWASTAAAARLSGDPVGRGHQPER